MRAGTPKCCSWAARYGEAPSETFYLLWRTSTRSTNNQTRSLSCPILKFVYALYGLSWVKVPFFNYVCCRSPRGMTLPKLCPNVCKVFSFSDLFSSLCNFHVFVHYRYSAWSLKSALLVSILVRDLLVHWKTKFTYFYFFHPMKAYQYIIFVPGKGGGRDSWARADVVQRRCLELVSV